MVPDVERMEVVARLGVWLWSYGLSLWSCTKIAGYFVSVCIFMHGRGCCQARRWHNRRCSNYFYEKEESCNDLRISDTFQSISAIAHPLFSCYHCLRSNDAY